MSIKIENYIVPERPPAPKKIPRTSDAPPFPPLPKPKELPVPPVASTEQMRRQHPKNAKHTRPSRPDERKSGELRERTCEEREPSEDPEADMCFVDGDGGGSPSDGFSDDSDESDESEEFGTTSGGSAEKCCAAVLLSEMTGAGALDDPLDCAELSNLLPSGGNDGIFDVILPSGDRLGVVVSGRPSSLSYLLSPSSEKLASRLRRQRMELEGRLERLTHRNVNITVL